MTPRVAAFAIPGDLNTVTGGYIYERRLLESLREIGHDVQYIPLGDSFPSPTATHMSDAIAALERLPADQALILDGLVFGSIDPGGLARIVAPIVAMIHHPLALETGLDDTTRDHLFRTERDNLTLAAHVLVPSPHTAQILTGTYGVSESKITIARPGSDRRPSKRLPTEPPLILSVGIQHPRKGHDTLLHALARLQAYDWTCVIVGSAYDPKFASDLANLVADLGLMERVTLAGRVSDATLDGLYKDASIFALATRYEGYGMVFDEALAWGLPIISCATGAVPETVPAKAGRLVLPDDPTAFAKALKEVLIEPDTRALMAQASALAGQGVPTWRQTAEIAGAVLNRLQR